MLLSIALIRAEKTQWRVMSAIDQVALRARLRALGCPFGRPANDGLWRLAAPLKIAGVGLVIDRPARSSNARDLGRTWVGAVEYYFSIPLGCDTWAVVYSIRGSAR